MSYKLWVFPYFENKILITHKEHLCCYRVFLSKPFSLEDNCSDHLYLTIFEILLVKHPEELPFRGVHSQNESREVTRDVWSSREVSVLKRLNKLTWLTCLDRAKSNPPWFDCWQIIIYMLKCAKLKRCSDAGLSLRDFSYSSPKLGHIILKKSELHKASKEQR